MEDSAAVKVMAVMSCTLAPISQCGGSKGKGCHMRRTGKLGVGAFEMVACAVSSKSSRPLSQAFFWSCHSMYNDSISYYYMHNVGWMYVVCISYHAFILSKYEYLQVQSVRVRCLADAVEFT